MIFYRPYSFYIHVRVLISMVLTDTGRLSAGPCSRGCTGSVLTTSEDVAGITPVVNSLWKSKVIPRLISMSQVFWNIAGHNYKNNLKFETFIMVFDKLLMVTVRIIGITLALLNTLHVYLYQWHSQIQEGLVPVHSPEDVQVRFLLPVRM